MSRDFGEVLVVDDRELPPGQMIPPHTHDWEDECLLVLEGELTCYVGGKVLVAPKGSYVIKPRGMSHAFYNASFAAVRVTEILTPGGLFFEGYFDEHEGIVSGALDGEGHREARSDLGGRYGISWHDEIVPEVGVRFGVGQEES